MTDAQALAAIRAAVRTVPDYPRPGILYRDITTLLADRRAFHAAVELLARPWLTRGISAVAGIEARGFIWGGALAQRLAAGFVPIRKKGKLPRAALRIRYQLEYGTDELEVHADAVDPGAKVLLVDDLLATGGTSAAAIDLMQKLQAQVCAACFVIELTGLAGASRLRELRVPVQTLVSF
ncbi:MAG: adenine phosphoribosyltransferase [Proteobacteria bacterium]|nr:adenine phosphoribosyltransferase [Pseudomonadota bacterium]